MQGKVLTLILFCIAAISVTQNIALQFNFSDDQKLNSQIPMYMRTRTYNAYKSIQIKFNIEKVISNTYRTIVRFVLQIIEIRNNCINLL